MGRKPIKGPTGARSRSQSRREKRSGEADAPADGKASGTPTATEFPIVGIGASAGGIEALTGLFQAMPTDSGMAFVVVLHLDPTRESQLAHILSQHTGMPVAEIADGMPVAPDHVYVIAPDSSLTLSRGTLRLSAAGEPRGQRRPVDVLFASLAEDRRERPPPFGHSMGDGAAT